MSGDFPIIPTSGSSSGANDATHPFYPVTSLQNVNPSTSITPSMSFSLVFRPSIPTLAIEEMDGGSGYQQNGGLFRSYVQETPTGRTMLSPPQTLAIKEMGGGSGNQQNGGLFRSYVQETPAGRTRLSPPQTLAIQEMGGGSGYQQNGGLFRSYVQETPTGRTRLSPPQTLAIEGMGGGSGYQQNGGLFRSYVQETPTGRARLSAPQIQALETMFKESPNPDQEQRQKLSRDLGLNPSKVKFWFQNRRTQEKIKQQRNDSARLEAENDVFERDIIRLEATLLGNITDGNVSELSTEVHQLCLENAEITKTNNLVRDLISRLGGVTHTLGRAASPIPSPLDSDTHRMISPNPPVTEHLDESDPEWLSDDETDPEWNFDNIMDDWYPESGLEVQYGETGDGVGATSSITQMEEAKKRGSNSVMPPEGQTKKQKAADSLRSSKEGDDGGHSPEAGGSHAAGELH